MNRIKFVITVLAIALFAGACKKQDEDAGTTTVDSLYLDYSPGFVPEPNNHYYKITGTMILEDTSRKLPADAANYNDTLPVKNNALATGLLHIPNQMKRNNSKTYKNDHVADCGGIAIRAFIGDKEYKWTLSDCYEGNKNVEAYAEKLRQAVSEFKK